MVIAEQGRATAALGPERGDQGRGVDLEMPGGVERDVGGARGGEDMCRFAKQQTADLAIRSLGSMGADGRQHLA